MSTAQRTLMHRPIFRALLIYAVTTIVYALCASPDIWTTHTRYNHFAWLADAFAQGRLHLAAPPPAYARGNDFAQFEGRWYVVFPPFPAVLLMPWVAVAKNVNEVRDGAFFLTLSGIAPAAQLWGLMKLRRLQLIVLRERDLWLLSLLFAFGTVYFFSAIQGTVWFAAHVVATSALSLFLAAAISAENPVLAGFALSAVIATRTHLGVAGIFFVMEALRVARRRNKSGLARYDWKLVVNRVGPLVAIAACTYGVLLWYNWLRFHNVFEVGYRFLQIAWRSRIERWGMFSYHYLARNLGIVLTSLPYLGPAPNGAPFRINGHGLALWLTTPLYLWLLWPKRNSPLHIACYATLIVTAVPSLLYQNSGWFQFGQRFSNDYSPVLFMLMALGLERISRLFHLAAAWSVAVNLFGALTFQRVEGSAYYYSEASQQVIYEPD